MNIRALSARLIAGLMLLMSSHALVAQAELPAKPKLIDAELPAHNGQPIALEDGIVYSVLRQEGRDAHLTPKMYFGGKVMANLTAFKNGVEYATTRKRPGKRARSLRWTLGEGAPVMDKMLLGLKFGCKIRIDFPAGYRGTKLTRPVKEDESFSYLLTLVGFKDGLRFPSMEAPNPKHSQVGSEAMTFEIVNPGSGPELGEFDFVVMRFLVWNSKKHVLTGTYVESRNKVTGTKKGLSQRFLTPILPHLKLGAEFRIRLKTKNIAAAKRDFPDGFAYWYLKVHKVVRFAPEVEELQETDSGLKYAILKPGQGAFATDKDLAVMHYQQWSSTGKQLDSSYQRGTSNRYRVNRLIPGWREMLKLMRPGSSVWVRIPRSLTGLDAREPPVPLGEDVIMQIELRRLDPMPGRRQKKSKPPESGPRKKSAPAKQTSQPTSRPASGK